VGWRCSDGAVRSLGADGRNVPPPHVNELYELLGVERRYHDENKPDRNNMWNIRDLGERFYQHCQGELNGDFSNIELLLDRKIIDDLSNKDLKHIILWATDQPENVSWQYRRYDTFWLAKLMEGKIKNTYPDVNVDILHPVVHANNTGAIREELEGFILPWTLAKLRELPIENEQSVLAIENKGSTPAIAQGLIVCVAALARQCQVIIYEPKEPDPLYKSFADGVMSVGTAVEYESFTISEYLWPLERSRVIDAWKQGNFSEAQLLLNSHQIRYRFLHQLAGYLAISSNWEISSFIENKNLENGWLRSKDVSQNASSEKVQKWRDRLLEVRQDDYAKIWESTFFIYILLRGQNYTAAFFQFAQTLERLLYVKSKKDDWFGKGLIEVPPEYQRENYNPGFKQLIDALFYSPKPKKKGLNHLLLDSIRETRNDLIHQAEPISLDRLLKVWSDLSWPIDFSGGDRELAILNRMQETMEIVTRTSDSVWNETMLFSLYQWGLEVLEAEEASNQF